MCKFYDFLILFQKALPALARSTFLKGMCTNSAAQTALKWVRLMQNTARAAFCYFANRICSVFESLRNRILARDLCTFMTHGPFCKACFTQNTCFFIRSSVSSAFYKPNYSNFQEFAEKCFLPWRGALFCPCALSVWGPKVTSRGTLGAPFVDLGGHFPPNNIAPRPRRKHNFKFWEKMHEKNPSHFYFFLVPENKCANFSIFLYFFKKTLPALVRSTFLKGMCTNSGAQTALKWLRIMQNAPRATFCDFA